MNRTVLNTKLNEMQFWINKNGRKSYKGNCEDGANRI